MGKTNLSIAAVQGADRQIPRRYPSQASAANISVAAVQGFDGQIPRQHTTRNRVFAENFAVVAVQGAAGQIPRRYSTRNRLLSASLSVTAVQGVHGQIPRRYSTKNRPLAVNLSVTAVQSVDGQVTKRYPTRNRVSVGNLPVAAAQGVVGQIRGRSPTTNRVTAIHEQIPRGYPTRNRVLAVQSAKKSCGSGSSKVESSQKQVKRKREEGNQKEMKKKKMEKEVVAHRQVRVAIEHYKLMGEEILSVAAVQGDDGHVPQRYPTRNRVLAANLSISAAQGVEGQNRQRCQTRNHLFSIHKQLPRRYPTRNWESAVQHIQESCDSGSSKDEGSQKKVKRRREEDNKKEKMVKEVVTRSQVRGALSMFHMIYRKLRKQEEAKLRYPGEGLRIVRRAYMIFKGKNTLNSRKYIGRVPGVEIGDVFQFRVELSLTNLHGEIHGPVDFTTIDGRNVAISLVSVSSFANYLKSSTVLFYSSPKVPSGNAENTNLTLKNSIADKIPVRVIRGIRYGDVTTYTYDGLFSVKECKIQKRSDGQYVYVFELRRMQGQPEVSIKKADSRRNRKTAGLRIEDISSGEEKIPIPVVNILDDELPTPFVYRTKLLYPPDCQPPPPRGCDCADGCTDTKKCACAVKNGGELPFNHNGDLVEAKPLVYECGPSCKCPPSCHNRVSQNGIKFPLEIFKTERMGWGVRCLTSIPSGSFVCEYIGEVLEDEEAQKRSSDVYLFAIGNNYYNKSLWEGLKTFIPDLHKSNGCDVVEDGGFTIDASRYGNVCRFINHSCTPNLYAQNLLRDHDDKTKPRVALFATENIPPLQELTYDYNYAVGEVHDSNGNIRRQDCYCGSDECIGRVY